MYEPRPFTVQENRKEAEGIIALTLAPEDGKPLFDFKAGQFVMLQLLNNDGSVWAQAAYSIANAPVEGKDVIELGIKVEGKFTSRCNALEVGEKVMLRGPYGVFTLQDTKGPHVFFAGGIGIVPIRSMIRQALLSGSDQEVFLFYSSKTRSQIAYEAELRDLASEYENFYPTFCVTRETVSGFHGECERVNVDLVKRYFTDFENGTYYMCGPVPFMHFVKEMLLEEDVDVDTCLRKEAF